MKKKLFLLCLFISILFLPLGISANEKTKTYKFYDIENKLVATQEIHEGDILSYVNVPKTIENKRFVGWFLEGTKFEDFGKKISLDDKTEVIIKALYEDAIYIRYHDALGNILKTEEVTKNSTVNIAKDYPLVEAITLTTKHDGWSLTKGGLTDVSGDMQITDKSIDLYPIIKEGYWISFQTNSDTVIPRQFIDLKDAVKKVKKPSDPYKKGYVFTKWYEDEALTKEYDFKAEVTKPMTLYAGYNDGKIAYQVRYFIEYQTDIRNKEAWGYKEIAKEYRKGMTGDKAVFDPELIFNIPYNIYRKGYELNTDKTVDTTINADGTTIYNVYYKARISTITISTRSVKMYGNDYKNMIPSLNDILIKEYHNIKYSENVEYIWEDLNKLGIIDYMNENNLRFLSEGGNIIVEPNEYKKHTYGDLYLRIEEQEKEPNYYCEIYIEVLDGKAPVGKAKEKNKSARGEKDNKEYYLYKKNSGYYNGIMWWDFKSKKIAGGGFTLVPELSDGHYIIKPSGFITFATKDYPGADLNRAYENGVVISYIGKDRPMRFYAYRNKYNIIFETNGAPKIEEIKDIPYNRRLYDLANNNFIEGKTVLTINGQEVVFGGWYTDAKFENKFNFNAAMPAKNIILYAKWNSRKYTVKFNTNGGTKVEDKENIEYGKTIAEPVTKKDGYIFLGWLYNNKPFDFKSGITENMTLNAEWEIIKEFQVSYDLNGGKGATPIDNNKYCEGAGAIVLKHDDIIAPFNKVFIGWKLDNNIYYPNSLAKVKKGGIVLKAIWEDGSVNKPEEPTETNKNNTGDILIMPNTGIKKHEYLQSLIIINLIFLTLALGTYKLKNNN